MKLTITINCDNAAFGSTLDAAMREAGVCVKLVGVDMIKLHASYHPNRGRQAMYDGDGNVTGYLEWTGVTSKWLENRS